MKNEAFQGERVAVTGIYVNSNKEGSLKFSNSVHKYK